MKKAFLVFSLCLVLALAGLTAAVVLLHDSRDDVEVTLTTLTGDPAQAQGLTARQQARHSLHLLWDLTIPLDDPARAETSFSYHPWELEWDPYQEDPLSLYTSESAVHYIEGTHTLPTEDLLGHDPAFSQLLPLLEEVAAQTEPGQSHSETVHPGEYLPSHPYSVYSSLPNTVLRYDETVSDVHDEEFLLSRFFQEAFPLAFSDEETWTVTVKKGETGYIEEVGYDSSAPTGQICLVTDYNDHALYLALSQDTWPQPDFGRFPQGNGVYRMDIVREGDEAYMEAQSLTNIYPLPDEAMVLDLTLDGEENLLVTWYDAGEYRCTILDGETMKPRETFHLFHQERSESEVIVCDNSSNEKYSYDTWSYVYLRAIPKEDFILFLGDQRFWLFLRTQEGWTEQFSAPLSESLWYASDLRMDAAWNGEKLALASADGWVSGLDLWIYDQAGELRYNGHYESSLTEYPDTEGYENRSDVVLMDGKEIMLAWQ